MIYAPHVKKAGHNIKNIQRNLLELGVDGCENWVFDAALAGYLLDATASGYELDRLTMAYCGFEVLTSAGEGEQLSLLDDAALDETARIADLPSKLLESTVFKSFNVILESAIASAPEPIPSERAAKNLPSSVFKT
jgi:DNA polymerase I-like protein with 3'-5' exonuclease and polymerase domains